MTTLGRIVGQKYRMLYPLGQGGMGAVWVGEHVELNFNVAVKFIDPRLAEDEHAKQRFRREAQAAAALKGRHAVSVFDYGIDEGDPYIVMELLEGETLASRLERDGRLSIESTRRLVTQAGKALARAHEQGIVHRDLKPENIFLVDDEPDFTVKLLDFGVAKMKSDADRRSEILTQPGHMLGTLFYMSPEQLQGSSVDANADIWAYAVVTYECLTGELPWREASGPQLIALICNEPFPRVSTVVDVPEALDAWFERATRKAPDERQSSIGQLIDTFLALTDGLSGKCALLDPEARQSLPSVVAYSSTEERERRRPSSIPAAINGRRDIDHIALIANISRTSAVLWTRHRAEPGQAIRLTLHFDNEAEGQTTLAEVQAVNQNRGDRPEIWPCEMTVRFAAPLPDFEKKIDKAGSE